MRHLVALPVVAALTLGAAGCTSDQESQALTGVETACALAGVGAQVAVTVITKGSAAGNVATTVGTGVSTGCGLLVPAVQAIVQKATAAGDTATVQVTTTAPSGTTRAMRFTARKSASGTVTYVIPPQATLESFLAGF